jgi:hypothetical protein
MVPPSEATCGTIALRASSISFSLPCRAFMMATTVIIALLLSHVQYMHS